MATLLALFLLLLPLHPSDDAPRPVPASTDAVDVASTVTHATVFLRGAQVTRTATLRVPAGTTTLRFTDLPPGLDAESLSLTADADLMVLSVAYERDYLAPGSQPAEVQTLQDQVQALRDSLTLTEALREVYQREEALLLANQSLGGSETGLSAETLRAAAALFRERLTEIKRLQIEREREVRRLQEALQAVQSQLNDRRRAHGPGGAAVVTVATDAPLRATFALRYLTQAAGWTPRYDLRLETLRDPLTLVYYGAVQQHTGEDWDDVRLTLSTGNPSRPGTRPTLDTWWLGFARPPAAPAPAMQLEEVVVTADQAATRVGRAVPVETRTLITTVAFDVDVPFSVPSDGRPHTVRIRTHEVPAHYEHYAAPRLEETAYLTARVTDYDDLHLLPGPASLFVEGTFLGRSRLDPTQASDTLTLSLGPDAGVVVEREQVRDYRKRSFFGNRTREQRAYELTVRNTKTVPVVLVLEDQLPRATDAAIDVDAADLSGGRLDAETGIVTWRLELAPGETVTRRLAFTVSFPRGREVVLP